MKSRLAPLLLSCVACVSPAGLTWAQGTASQYVPAHGEPYGTARIRLIQSGWEPVPGSCDRKQIKHICWGPEQPELATDVEANTNCGRFRKAAKILTVCTYVIPDAIFVDTVTIADEH